MYNMNPILLFNGFNNDIIINAVNCTTFNFTLGYTGSIRVEWGDGTFQNTGGAFNKTYSSPFTGVIKIKGNLNSVTSFYSISNTGIRIDLKEFWKFKTLQSLDLQGNCFINNTILDIPRVTGNLILSNLPNFTATGTILDIPRVTGNLIIENASNVTLTGNIINLPRVTNILSFTNSSNITLTGNIIDLPRVTTSLVLSNLPNFTATGNIIDLPRVTNILYLSNLPNFTATGTILDIPRVTGNLILSSLPNFTATGDFANLPLTNDTQITGIISSYVSYTALTPKRTTIARVQIEMSTKFTTTQTDNILIDYATFSTTWTSPRTIRFSSLGRTSASDSAVATLVGRGVTITLV